jgi:20S proteasome alpha/beta subunit
VNVNYGDYLLHKRRLMAHTLRREPLNLNRVRENIPQRKRPQIRRIAPVTVAIVCPFEDGVLFCADTKISTGYEKRNQSKILFRQWGDKHNAVSVFALSGSLPYATAAAEHCERKIAEIDFANTSLDAIQGTIDAALNDYYQSHVFPHPDRYTGAVAFDLLMGLWLNGNTRILVTQQTALTKVHGYECVGSGGYLARYVLRQALGSEIQFKPDKLSLVEATVILEHAINSAVEYDEACDVEKDGPFWQEAEYVGMMRDGETGDIRERHLLGRFPEELQKESWGLIRRLARNDGNPNEQEIAIEEFCDAVQKLHEPTIEFVRSLDTLPVDDEDEELSEGESGSVTPS